ncbi:SRPBCC domain-containing protein [Candidatus Parvarchaeota archaeon]|nr:SRPBCC domain-containing protein [Candidatus Parvarchaeota archaeon]
MEIKGSFTVNYNVEKVWDIVADANKFAKCLPNVVSTEANGDNFQLQFKADAKKYTSKFLGASYLSNLNIKFSAQLKEKQENKHILIQGDGSTIGLKFSLSLYIDLSAQDSSTKIDWKAEIELGRMAKLFGEEVVNQAVTDVVNQTIDNLKNLLK